MSSQPAGSPAEIAMHYDGARGCALRYLAAMEARDLDTASRLVSADLELVFPGSVRRSELGEIVSGSAARYRRIGKRVEGCDLCELPDGTSVVYVRGTLHGQWPDGSDFAGIRFIDRFELRDGLIRRQEVWNDAGEWRLRERRI
uniref:Nuclear transport factor 2 family protein n=1 Tax=Bosea sp. NBC_00436 TaxID=2969620 RepID=A0A9E7ZQZ5_9HYPH